ncbi:disulfide reductase [Candidatus Geothermarchaeota archaeon ex4572_27]|nr:MAG: disulfide reductase [Candidatus Geothermarchaeota archaeon ex4572_27]
MSKAEEEKREEVRIGVYVCHCGINIAGVVDVKAVAEYAKTLPNVVVARDYVFMCSAPGQEMIKKDIKEHKLNRVVVAACSPAMHEPTFRAVVEEAGLNPYLFEMANIREHCSWVHPDVKEVATEKAKDIVRRAVAKVTYLEPLERIRGKVVKSVLVIGGGVAGMRAALDLAARGFDVHLIERRPTLGGYAARIGYLDFNMRGADLVKKLIEEISKSPRIKVYTNAELVALEGSVGDFVAKVRRKPRFVSDACNACGECAKVCPVEVPNEYEFGLVNRKAIYLPFDYAYPRIYVIDPEACNKCGKCVEVCKPKAINLEEKEEEIEISVGAVVVAAGYRHYEPKEGELGYKKSKRVITLFQLQRLLAEDGPTKGELVIDGVRPKSIAFVSCVGSMSTTPEAATYCSRMCCSSALKDILRIKERYPDIDIYYIYKDLRTYGRDEDLYWKSIEKMVRFLRYEETPTVTPEDGGVTIELFETTVQERIRLTVDAVVLVNGMAPPEGIEELSGILKVGRGPDGFFKEAHLKLRPVEALTDGIFLAGAVTGPKNIIESVTAGSAAAAKAAALVSKDYVEVEPITSAVNEEICSGCGMCASVCPYDAISIEVKEGRRVAKVNELLCKGCGACAATCPSGAMQQRHFTDTQLRAEITALAKGVIP